MQPVTNEVWWPMPEDNAEPPIRNAEIAEEVAGEISAARPSLPTITSAELLLGGREVQIRHGAEVYVLRLTRNGKLILTK